MGRLLLWDIDHTLIESGRVGILAYAEAFAKVTGHPLDTMPELAGRPEPVIFREATAADLAAAGATTVLPDLTDTSAVVAAILQASE